MKGGEIIENNIKEKVINILSERLSIDKTEIGLDSHLMDDLGVDSLDLVELVMAIEETYNIEIPDDDVEKLYTPRKIIDYISSLGLAETYK